MLYGDRSFPVRLVADIDSDAEANDKLHAPIAPFLSRKSRGRIFDAELVELGPVADRIQLSLKRCVFIVRKSLGG